VLPGQFRDRDDSHRVRARARFLNERSSSAREYDRHRFREVEVTLSSALTFRMLEVRHASFGQHWSRIWPTSIGLSRWLLSRPATWLPTSAVEIGCGVGLVSVTLAHLKVAVEGTDREPVALLLTEQNAARNAVDGLTTGRLDWTEPDGVGTPMLFAADVLYEPAALPSLFALIHTAELLEPCGELVIAGPRRRHELLQEFVHAVEAEGYTHEEEDVHVEWKGENEVIAIHTLRRAAAPAGRTGDAVRRD